MKIGMATASICRQFPDERDEIRQYAEIGFEALDYAGSVSYTHLDVYKRQIQNSAIQRVITERGKPVYATASRAGTILIDNGNMKLIGNVKVFNK